MDDVRKTMYIRFLNGSRLLNSINGKRFRYRDNKTDPFADGPIDFPWQHCFYKTFYEFIQQYGVFK